MLVDGLAVAVLHPVDQRWDDLASAIGDRGVGRGHAQVGRFACPQCHRQHRIEGVVDAEHLGVFGHERHAQILRQPDGHDVAGILDALAERLRPVKTLRVVLRPPDRAVRIDHLDGRIEDHRGRRISIVERRRIDDRLERRSGLSQRLRRAVEFGFRVREPADHREDAPGARVHGHQCALDLGHLLQGVIARLALDRRHVNHVADLEDRRELLAHPFDIGSREGADHPVGQQLALDVGARAEADLGLVGVHLEDHGQRPFGHVAQRPDGRDRLAPIARNIDGCDGLAEAPVLIVLDQPVHQGAACIFLQRRFERRTDRKPAAIELVLAVERAELPADFLGEILGGVDLAAGLARQHVERVRLGGVALFPGDVAVLEHAIEHVVAALDRRLGMAERVVVVRSLGQTRNIGHLAERQLVEGLVEIIERGRRDPVRVQPQENLVHIELEDLLLAERALDAQRQDRFLDLSVPGLLGGQQEILGDLLGDRRTAALDRGIAVDARHDVVAQRTDHAVDRNPVVRVEILVLGGDEGLQQLGRDGLDRLEQPPLMRIFGQQRAVGGVDARRDGGLVVLEHGIIGQPRRHLIEIDDARDDPCQCAKYAEAEQPAEKSKH